MLYLAAILGGTGALAVAILLWRLAVAKRDADAWRNRFEDEHGARVKSDQYATRITGEANVLRRETEGHRKRWAALADRFPHIHSDLFYGVLPREEPSTGDPATGSEAPGTPVRR